MHSLQYTSQKDILAHQDMNTLQSRQPLLGTGNTKSWKTFRRSLRKKKTDRFKPSQPAGPEVSKSTYSNVSSYSGSSCTKYMDHCPQQNDCKQGIVNSFTAKSSVYPSFRPKKAKREVTNDQEMLMSSSPKSAKLIIHHKAKKVASSIDSISTSPDSSKLSNCDLSDPETAISEQFSLSSLDSEFSSLGSTEYLNNLGKKDLKAVRNSFAFTTRHLQMYRSMEENRTRRKHYKSCTEYSKLQAENTDLNRIKSEVCDTHDNQLLKLRTDHTGYTKLKSDEVDNSSKKSGWFCTPVNQCNGQMELHDYLNSMDTIFEELERDGYFYETSPLFLSLGTALLEVPDPRVLSGNNVKHYQPYKGMLTLEISADCGLLTVHIKEARHLQNLYLAQNCSIFVKVNVIPDQAHKNRSRSSFRHVSTNLIFNEKLMLELKKGDFDKRLLVSIMSVGNSQGGKQNVDVLGCMSFAISEILAETQIKGTFYLLSEYMGRNLYLEAVNQIPAYSVRYIVLPNITSGYGIGMYGRNPVYVLNIQAGSLAEQAGLCVGDELLEVCGRDVIRCTKTTIKQIIEQEEEYVTLTVCRREY